MGGAMTLCNPALKEETLEQLDFALSVCQALDVDIFFTRVMWPAPGMPQAETWAACEEITRTVCERSAERGIRFALEADPPCFVHTLERVERLMELVDHPNFWLNYDPTNYYVVGSDPLLVIERYADRIINGHVKDAVYRADEKEERPVGEGGGAVCRDLPRDARPGTGRRQAYRALQHRGVRGECGRPHQEGDGGAVALGEDSPSP